MTETTAAGPSGDDRPELIAYQVHEGVEHPIIAGPVARAWMDATPGRFANRCLPMLIANQAGWLLLNPVTVLLTWDGTRSVSGVSVVVEDESVDAASESPRPPAGVLSATSHFGQGIVTWHVPYLFRTSPGWNLLVRGPSNCPKDGIYALEGLVETDWTAATFTMNWQLTRPGLAVRFEAGEPYAMVVPQRRGDVELFEPVVRSMAREPQLLAEHRRWAASREVFNRELRAGDLAEGPGWQREYFQGRGMSGDAAQQHQRRLHVREFSQEPPARDGR
jgi:hypothetical protein